MNIIELKDLKKADNLDFLAEDEDDDDDASFVEMETSINSTNEINIDHFHLDDNNEDQHYLDQVSSILIYIYNLI